ncbi:MarR family transcriptional regulator [Sphingomonadaceae bacterium jetA1]|jgi:DNA-binding MarR family transcriptional regulator|uniref:MarR family winged helix-turn-helix transcriptional regulator n=1 Tax=Facivitalis istanbulensis TaxID=3075838 RepID=UPI003477F3EC
MAAANDTATLGPLDSFVGYHMRRASARMSVDFHAAMAETGIRQVVFGVLSVIAANPGINQGQIGKVLGIQRANMVSLIGELTDAGYVSRTTSPEDRRAFVFQLTDRGAAAFADGLARIRLHEDRLLRDLSVGERETLVALLKRIQASGAD